MGDYTLQRYSDLHLGIYLGLFLDWRAVKELTY